MSSINLQNITLDLLPVELPLEHTEAPVNLIHKAQYCHNMN